MLSPCHVDCVGHHNDDVTIVALDRAWHVGAGSPVYRIFYTMH